MSNYTHVLVAVDFAASADAVLAKASEIVRRNNAKLSVLHVVEYLPPIDYANDSLLFSDWGVEEEVLLKNAKQSMQEYGKKHKLDNADLKVELGVPKHQISQYVKDNQCDLVVLGSHGRHGISLLLGSTANAVLHDMPCDVLTIKIQK